MSIKDLSNILFHNFFLAKNVIFEENKIVSDTTSLRVATQVFSTLD